MRMQRVKLQRVKLQRVKFYPQMGKDQEMLQVLQSWVKTRLSQGGKLGLATQAFAPEGIVFVITIRLNDPAELDQSRQQNRTDQAFQDFLAETASLSRLPAQVELLEVLVPVPS